MSFAASSYWSVTCARARSTAPSMPGRSWLCWFCDRSGHVQNYLPWRLRFLPLADVVVVRAQRGLHCRHRQEQGLNALTAQRQRDAPVPNWVPRCVGFSVSWDRKRRVIARGLKGAGKTYDKLYCREMENRRTTRASARTAPVAAVGGISSLLLSSLASCCWKPSGVWPASWPMPMSACA